MERRVWISQRIPAGGGVHPLISEFALRVGCSTGSRPNEEWELVARRLRQLGFGAIEWMCRTPADLVALDQALDALAVVGRDFRHCSYHAPTEFRPDDEWQVVARLKKMTDRWPGAVIVHPDMLSDLAVWRKLGSRLLLENMDLRKPIGQSADDLAGMFQELPEAGLCFDIGHALQVDPSLAVAETILRMHGERLAEVHFSEVLEDGAHVAASAEFFERIGPLARSIPANCPIILENAFEETVCLDQVDRLEKWLNAVPGD